MMATPTIGGCSLFFFFFNDTATTEIYTLSLHDALPISVAPLDSHAEFSPRPGRDPVGLLLGQDRKSTRLNSSHGYISYAVFCLKKKNKDSGVTMSHARIPRFLQSHCTALNSNSNSCIIP